MCLLSFPVLVSTAVVSSLTNERKSMHDLNEESVSLRLRCVYLFKDSQQFRYSLGGEPEVWIMT